VGFKLDDSDDVISILDQGGSTNHFHKELVDLLMSYLFLVPSHELELDWMKTRLIDGNKMKRSDTLRLVIAPTTKCNFDCSYCYQRKYNDKLSMDSITTSNVIEFIRFYISRNQTRKLNIVWYGGEPTLEIDLISHISESIKDLFDDGNYKASIITNGYFFTRDVRNKLVDNNVTNVQITIDGVKGRHDRFRKLKDGSGTYDTIIRNLVEACKEERFNIAVRVNTQSSFGDIYIPLFNEFKQLGIDKKISVSIAFIRDQKPNNDDIVEQIEWIEYDKRYVDYCDNNDLHRHVRLKILRPRVKRCMVFYPNNFVIAPNGDLYSCIEEIGDYTNRKKPYSNVSMSYDNIIKRKSYEINQWSEAVNKNLFNDNVCMGCKYLPICFGGCPKEIINSTNFRKNHRCLMQKFDIDYYVSKVYERSVDSGAFTDDDWFNYECG